MPNHMSTLILVMIVMGALGGLVNYTQTKKSNEDDSSIYYSLIIGIAASALVPLFLYMTSSDLVSASETDSFKLLIFAGFCLLAAISGTSFITKLHDITEIEKDVDSLIDDVTEEDDENNVTAKKTNSPVKLSDNEINVLKSFLGTKYIRRSRSGISKQTKLNLNTVENTLNKLANKKLVRKVRSKKNNGLFLWSITPKGKTIAKN